MEVDKLGFSYSAVPILSGAFSNNWDILKLFSFIRHMHKNALGITCFCTIGTTLSR